MGSALDEGSPDTAVQFPGRMRFILSRFRPLTQAAPPGQAFLNTWRKFRNSLPHRTSSVVVNAINFACLTGKKMFSSLTQLEKKEFDSSKVTSYLVCPMKEKQTFTLEGCFALHFLSNFARGKTKCRKL